MSANNTQKNVKNIQPMPENYYKLAIDVFKCANTRTNEKIIFLFIVDFCKQHNLSFKIDITGNIIIDKGQGVKSCFVSHLDTVHDYNGGFNVLYKKDKHFYLYAFDDDNKQVGIGGDDKCGVFVCLFLLLNCENIKVVFFTGEESGGTGSNEINLKEFENISFIAGVDRWGNNDFICKYGGQNTVSDNFLNKTKGILKKYGYSKNSGMFTDSLNLFDRQINISCINLSCGYYLHHTNQEYVDLNELYQCACLSLDLTKIEQIIYSHENKFAFNKFDYDDFYPIKYGNNWRHEINTGKVCSNCGDDVYDNLKYCDYCRQFLEEIPFGDIQDNEI